MGLLVNPVSVRLGVANRWFDIIAINPSIYSEVLHNVLTLREILMRVTWMPVMHVRGIASSHVNIFLYNQYYYIHVYFYDGYMEMIYMDFIYMFIKLSQAMYYYERNQVIRRTNYIRKFGFDENKDFALAKKEEFSFTFRIFAFFLSLIQDWTSYDHSKAVAFERKKNSPEKYGVNSFWWSKFRRPWRLRKYAEVRHYLKRDLISLRIRLALINKKSVRPLWLKSVNKYYKFRLIGLMRKRMILNLNKVFNGLCYKVDNFCVTMDDFINSRSNIINFKKTNFYWLKDKLRILFLLSKKKDNKNYFFMLRKIYRQIKFKSLNNSLSISSKRKLKKEKTVTIVTRNYSTIGINNIAHFGKRKRYNNGLNYKTKIYGIKQKNKFMAGYYNYLDRFKKNIKNNVQLSNTVPKWIRFPLKLNKKWIYFALLKKLKLRMINLKKSMLRQGRWLTKLWRKRAYRLFKGFFFRVWARIYKQDNFLNLWRLYEGPYAGAGVYVLFFEFLKWFYYYGFRMRGASSSKYLLKITKWSTYIWLFSHYEVLVGGVYFPFRYFYSKHRKRKALDVRKLYLDLGYMRELDYYLVKFVNYYARFFVWFLYGRFSFLSLRAWLLRKIYPFSLFPVNLKLYLIGNDVITASYLSKFIAFKLEHRYSFMELLRPIKRELRRVVTYTNYLRGFKIQFSGRKTRRDRSRRTFVTGGALSLSRRSHYVEYSCSEIILHNSINSIRIWFYRPYISVIDLHSMRLY